MRHVGDHDDDERDDVVDGMALAEKQQRHERPEPAEARGADIDGR